MLSVCNSGSAYGWSSNFDVYTKVKTAKKKGGAAFDDANSASATKLEFIMKGIRIHAVGYDEEFDLLFCSSSDSKLTIFTTDNGKGCRNYMQLNTEGNKEEEITSLLLAK